jgi:type IV pilus assembly protein PilA
MTTLNSRLQLAMLNRKKSKNILQKGFTLVELMIVIVIVGILSSVALPSFLGQAGKAKITEAQSLASGYIKEYKTELLGSTTAANAVETACIPATTDWTFGCTKEVVTVSPTTDNNSYKDGTLIYTVNDTSNTK